MARQSRDSSNPQSRSSSEAAAEEAGHEPKGRSTRLRQAKSAPSKEEKREQAPGSLFGDDDIDTSDD